MSRRRSRRGPPRCKDCKAPIVFFRSPMTGNYRPFDPRPVDPNQQHVRPPCPVENDRHAWPYRALIEDLMVRLGCSEPEAEEHARAMPWHMPHTCKNTTQEPEQ